MRGAFRIEGYAIVSADWMIADSTGFMPESLKFESDQLLLAEAFDRAAIVVHGRLSFEDQPNSPHRHRLIPTRKVASLARDADNPNACYWNPAGAPLEEACAALGRREGMIAVAGGTDIFSLFLTIGYDAFYLPRAENVQLPDGVPVFAEGRRGLSPCDTLRDAGLSPARAGWLEDCVSLAVWTAEHDEGAVCFSSNFTRVDALAAVEPR